MGQEAAPGRSYRFVAEKSAPPVAGIRPAEIAAATVAGMSAAVDFRYLCQPVGQSTSQSVDQ
eukprot:56415-Prorocentrum_minimum.AAC.6